MSAMEKFKIVQRKRMKLMSKIGYTPVLEVFGSKGPKALKSNKFLYYTTYRYSNVNTKYEIFNLNPLRELRSNLLMRNVSTGGLKKYFSFCKLCMT